MSCVNCLDREDRDFPSGCSCDHPAYPPCDPISPGLSQLPPQALGFPQVREALLGRAGQSPPLAGWSARADDDLGVMLLESWAYVLDVIHFYNRRHSARGFLRTAPDALALQRLAALIGYRPRQATGGSVTVAAIAGARGPALLPVGTQLRSQGVPGVPPQVFEVSVTATADPRTNEWALAQIRPLEFSGLVAFAPGAAGTPTGSVVALTLAGTPSAAARVTAFAGTPMPDGADYRVASLAPAPGGLVGQPLAHIGVYAMAQSAAPTTFPPAGTFTATAASDRTEWVLDGVYPQLTAGDLAVVETTTGSFVAQALQNVAIADIELGKSGAAVTGKATKVTLAAAANVRRLHFRAVPAGSLINPAAETVAIDDLRDAALPLLPPVASLGDAAPPTRFIAADQGDPGALLDGKLTVGAHGVASVQTGGVDEAATSGLAMPARLLGNLVELTRGQTVANEVLGSADASQPFQRFRLKNKPLTYFPDAARPGAVAPELEVRVNGILWTRVESFLAAREGAQVYIVRHTPTGDTDIVFGTKVRPPTGVRNVTATYRFGAGASVPPPGKLTQVVGKVPNLSRIIAPLAVRGGSDAEAPDTIRAAAPRSTLPQGRAVSLADYAALVAVYPGVIASAVDWAWTSEAQRAGVLAWIVSQGGDVSDELAAALAAAGDPLTTVTVVPAIPVAVNLALDLVVDSAFVAADVHAAVTQALTDPSSGLLAPRNAVIGGALFRSAVARAARGVAGVAEIRTVLVDGDDMPAAVQAQPGHYLAFNLSVGGN